MNKAGKKPFKKIELTIYFLAVMAFSLLVYLFINRNETSLVLKEESNKIQNKALAYNSDSPTPLNTTSQDLAINDGALAVKETPITTNLSKIDPSIQSSDTVSSVEPIKDNGNSNAVSEIDRTTVAPVKEEVVSAPKKQPSRIQKKSKSVRKVAYKDKKRNKSYKQNKKPGKKVAYANKRGKKINSGSYNWTVLNRYKGKPNQKLYPAASHKVKHGDSIWRIAKKYRVSALNLLAANPSITDPDALIFGQKIVIPNR